jgi:hypothetical protein
MGDAVTLLSNQWVDWLSFSSPNAYGGRSWNGSTSSPVYGQPLSTYYRMAIVQGKNPTAPYANFNSTTLNALCLTNVGDTGTDGGTPNFLRFLENWGNTLSPNPNQSVYYDGSMVSFFYSEYFTGYYKDAQCGSDVYSAPLRTYAFDTDFQTYSLLPPGTPMLRDVENVGFQQLFTPY